MKRSGIGRLIVISGLAIVAYAVLYAVLRPLLPGQLARHAGPDGAGYGPLWLAALVIGAVAAISLLIGILAYRDFYSLGHWYPGPKAIVVCFLAAGFGILSLGASMLVTVMGRQAQEAGSLPVGMGLLGLVVAFGLSAPVLAWSLPRAKQETLVP